MDKKIEMLYRKQPIKSIYDKIYHLGFFDFLFRDIDEDCLDLIGTNWHEGTHKPIAILWGFNPWKREHISAILKEYRTAFVLGKVSWARVKKNIQQISLDTELTFFSWSYKAPKSAEKYARRKKIDFIRVEDGFLRSVTPGIKRTKALSLVFDKTGIYFNKNVSSDLEEKIISTNFANDSVEYNDTKIAIELFKAFRLTKYFDIFNTRDFCIQDHLKKTDFNIKSFLQKEDNTKVLILGQVEDDQSIIHGSNQCYSIEKIISVAQEKYPDAKIFFRPHPDVYYKNRVSEKDVMSSGKRYQTLDLSVPIYDLIEQFDHIYTTTSLSGFEALIQGKKVTTMGSPFYSNWGLTIDHESIRRRRGHSKTLEELFHATYISYPTYIHPDTNEEISYFEIVSYLIIEKICAHDIFDAKKFISDLDIINKYKEKLSLPVHIFMYLLNTSFPGEADVQETLKIIHQYKNEDYMLRDFVQVTQLLIKTSNYDALKSYIDVCLNEIESNIVKYGKNIAFLDTFFHNLSIVQKNLNGRRINDIHDIFNHIDNKLIVNSSLKNSLYINYIKCLSNNIQYDALRKTLNEFQFEEGSKTDLVFIKKLCETLKLRSTRNEISVKNRNFLLQGLCNKYLKYVNFIYTGEYDHYINKILHHLLVENRTRARMEFKTLCSILVRAESTSKVRLLKQRKNDIFSIFDNFLSDGHISLANDILKLIEEVGNASDLNKFKMQYYLKNNLYADYIEKYSSLNESERNNNAYLTGYITSLRGMGDFHKAIEALSSFNTIKISNAKRSSLNNEKDKIDFSIKSGEIINSYSQPKLPKGVIFIAHNCYNTFAMVTPALLEAKKLGYAVVNLMSGLLPISETGIDFIDKYHNIIPLYNNKDGYSNSWHIDWENRIVEADGVNYYQGFYETLSSQFRAYFLDINEPHFNKIFFDNLRRSDLILSICNNIYKDISIKNNMPAIFVSGNSQMSPFSIIRDFCRAKDHDNLSFINCNVAYESYFSNIGSKFSSTMALCDMTLQRDRRAPFLPDKEEFNEWYEKNQDNSEFLQKANEMVYTDRTKSGNTLTHNPTIEMIERIKREGKKVICAFGKIPIDLAVPYDGGPGHTDLADWLDHTISIVNEMEDDAVLLIKPHPHELVPEIALDLISNLESLIRVERKENIILLKHKDTNVHQLAPHLDLAILWNGSSANELVVQGVPTMMCSYFGQKDYPIDFIYPESREQYAHYLKQMCYNLPSEEVRKKAAFVISYMGTSEIAIMNRYSRRQLTNDKVGLPKWYPEKVRHFLDHGDPEMEKAAKIMVKKSEINASKKRKAHYIDV